MSWTGKPCLFTIQSLIKIEISKKDGALQHFGWWIWKLVHFLILFCSFHWCVWCLCCDQTLVACVIQVIIKGSILYLQPYEALSSAGFFSALSHHLLYYLCYSFREDHQTPRHVERSDSRRIWVGQSMNSHFWEHSKSCGLKRWGKIKSLSSSYVTLSLPRVNLIN